VAKSGLVQLRTPLRNDVATVVPKLATVEIISAAAAYRRLTSAPRSKTV
jgi:hypothetical protein